MKSLWCERREARNRQDHQGGGVSQHRRVVELLAHQHGALEIVRRVDHHDRGRLARDLLLVQVAQIEATRGGAAAEIPEHDERRVGVVAIGCRIAGHHQDAHAASGL